MESLRNRRQRWYGCGTECAAPTGIRPMKASSYDLNCPVARTLAIIGERWTVLIMRDLLMEGPRKFQDLEAALSGISPTTLSARLKTLEEHGIVARRFYSDHPPRAEYALTDKGRALGPALKA